MCECEYVIMHICILFVCLCVIVCNSFSPYSLKCFTIDMEKTYILCYLFQITYHVYSKVSILIHYICKFAAYIFIDNNEWRSNN